MSRSNDRATVSHGPAGLDSPPSRRQGPSHLGLHPWAFLVLSSTGGMISLPQGKTVGVERMTNAISLTTAMSSAMARYLQTP
jgi:hypothetical protein